MYYLTYMVNNPPNKLYTGNRTPKLLPPQLPHTPTSLISKSVCERRLPLDVLDDGMRPMDYGIIRRHTNSSDVIGPYPSHLVINLIANPHTVQLKPSPKIVNLEDG